MKSPPRISVIIAVYNGAEYLSQQMDALLAQECEFSWEALYVDNGSTDSSREIISQRIEKDGLVHVRLVDGSQQQGQVHARNVGSKLARADLLAFTDQDDMACPTWLAEIIKSLAHHDAVGGYTICLPFGYPLHNTPTHVSPPNQGFPKCCGFEWASGNNIGIHRRILKQIGWWETVGVHAGEDVDLWIRLQLSQHSITYAKDAQVYWRPRIRIRDIFRQGITYGRSEVLIYTKYREHGAVKRNLRGSLRTIKQTIHALTGFFQTPRSYLGINKSGMLTGRILQSIRSRTFYL